MLASPEWAESHDREWTDGQTITAAIGQSYNLDVYKRQDRELPQAAEALRNASRMGVDAVLVQDWGCLLYTSRCV